MFQKSTRAIGSRCRLIVLTVALAGNPSFCGAGDRPDVLFILVDDLRPMLGCYGDSRVNTPNIDRLARRGVVFENAYCQYAKCGTSRLSLLTGLRPDSVGVFSNNNCDVRKFRERHENAFSIPAWLKRHGYYSEGFGKIYHDGWDQPTDWSTPSFSGRDREMWEVVDTADPRRPTRIAERLDCPVIQSPDVSDDHLFAGRMTERVLKTLRTERRSPHFLAVGFRRPHLPFVAPRRYFDVYEPDESWLAKNSHPPQSVPAMAWFNSDGYIGSARKVGLTMPARPTRDQAIAWNGYEMRSYVGVPNRGPIDTALQLRLLHAYAACVSYVDAQIGRLLDVLEESGRRDNTIVILTSDHGWHLGEHSAWGKMTNYEVATRVPLIISAPGIEAGRTEAISELVDLYPTLCDLTVTPLPDHIQGDSLRSVLNEPSKDFESLAAVSQYSRFRDRFMGYALRTNRYRYVRWIEVATGKVAFRELYDHRNDAAEMNNLGMAANSLSRIVKLDERLKQANRQ